MHFGDFQHYSLWSVSLDQYFFSAGHSNATRILNIGFTLQISKISTSSVKNRVDLYTGSTYTPGNMVLVDWPTPFLVTTVADVLLLSADYFSNRMLVKFGADPHWIAVVCFTQIIAVVDLYHFCSYGNYRGTVQLDILLNLGSNWKLTSWLPP